MTQKKRAKTNQNREVNTREFQQDQKIKQQTENFNSTTIQISKTKAISGTTNLKALATE